MSPPTTIDYAALAQKYGGAAAAPSVDYDAIAAKHGGSAAAQDQPSWLSRAGSALASDIGAIAKGAVDPKNIALNAATLGMGSTVQTLLHAPEAVQHYQEQKAAGYSLPYRVLTPVAEGAGVNVQGMEQSAREGDTAGVVGHALAVPAVMAATAGLAKAAPVISDTVSAVADRARMAASRVTPKQVAQTAGGATGGLAGAKLGAAIPGHEIITGGSGATVGARYGADWAGRAAEALLGKDRANAPIFASNPDLSLNNINDALAQTIADDRARAAQPGFPNQSEGLPEVEEGQASATQHLRQAVQPPPSTAGNALGLIKGTGAISAAQSGEALASIGPKEPAGGASATRVNAQDRAQATELTRALSQQLSEALGGKVLQPDVPLRQQMLKGVPAEAPQKLPQGFSPVDSSALRGFKYEPQAREMEIVTNAGEHYVYGDVSPQDAATFQAADSKGKAFQGIKNNPLVAKIVNGKRVSTRPIRPTSSLSDLLP